MMRPRVGLLLILLLGLAACSSSNDDNVSPAEKNEVVAPGEVGSADDDAGTVDVPEPTVTVDPDDPTSVVQAFAEALEIGADQRASELFQEGAWIVAGDRTFNLREPTAALNFVSTFPCYGEIVTLDRNEDQVATTFLMHQKSDAGSCPLDGEETLVLFTVRDGKIFIWEDLGLPEDVIYSWALALSTANHPRASDFYAPDAQISLSGLEIVLPARRDVIAFHDASPCNVEVEELSVTGNEIEATLVFADRSVGECEIAGRRESVFLLENGRIQEWREISTSG